MNKLYLIMFIYLFAMNCYCLYKIKKISIEGFTDTSNTDLIKKEINNIYQADINAIRNLASIAEELQSGGKNGLLTIPGNVKIEGVLNVNKDIYGKKNIISSNTVQGNSLFSQKNQSWIGYYGDGKNYLRGVNRMEGNVETGMNIAGNLNVSGASNVSGKKVVTEGKLMKLTNPQYGNLGSCNTVECGGYKYNVVCRQKWNDNTTKWKLSTA